MGSTCSEPASPVDTDRMEGILGCRDKSAILTAARMYALGLSAEGVVSSCLQGTTPAAHRSVVDSVSLRRMETSKPEKRSASSWASATSTTSGRAIMSTIPVCASLGESGAYPPSRKLAPSTTISSASDRPARYSSSYLRPAATIADESMDVPWRYTKLRLERVNPAPEERRTQPGAVRERRRS